VIVPKVGLNLVWLVPGVVGGSEEYTVRLLEGIAERDEPGIAITLYVLDSFVAAHPGLAAAFPTVIAPIDGANKARRVVAESTWLAQRARRDRMALVHHAGGTIPPLRLSPSMVTIHDVQPLLFPGNFDNVKQSYLRWRLPASARHARLVITQTDYGRSALVDVLRVPPERIAKVPPGFIPTGAQAPEHDPAATYRLDRPFFLYPAITYPHKNHRMLLRAFAQVAKDHDVLLVLTAAEAQEEGDLRRDIADLGVAERVRRLGRVPRPDLDWMLRHAVALTFPSRFEGFGLPVLEAMGNGCPVIAAAATALPEVVGPAGIILDPDDVGAWARAMTELLTDERRREWFVEAGFARTASFRWGASVDASLAAYHLALGLGRR
jgi:glycosyltransferase involved in cell wall biosynthesis